MNFTPLETKAVLDFPLMGVQLIEASAGTGKTYTIANLYLRQVVEGRSVGELLVVTFTKAATDELRGRIRARLFETLACLEQGRATQDEFLQGLLERIGQDGRSEQVIKRLRLAVRSMDESSIFTIHSFCQRALTEFAFNSGQQFQMELLTDDRALWDEAVADWWRRQAYPLTLAHLGIFKESLAGQPVFRHLLSPLLGPQKRILLPQAEPLATVLSRFDAALPLLACLAARWREEGENLKRLLLESEGLSRAQTSPYHPDRLISAFDAIDAYFADDPTGLPPKDFDVLMTDTLDAKRLKRGDPALDDGFFHECNRVGHQLLILRRDLLAAALADAADFVHGQVRAKKQRVQALSFDDLLTEMNRALEGHGGEALAESIRQQFPVAMIDEFQDTDPVQYAIFRRLYLGQSGLNLVMIGDPKQAIYSFRGGDIHTYMQAKGDLEETGLYTLTTNWRSTPAVIHAVNCVFQRRPATAFVYGDHIPFLPAQASDKAHGVLYRAANGDDEPQAALTLWTLPEQHDQKGKLKAMSKEATRALCHAAVADEIVRLIAGGRTGEVRLDASPLQPRDIAVLVRTSYEAAELRKALAWRGVNAVSVARKGVFETAEAEALETVLRAVSEPRDRQWARLALMSSLLGQDYARVEAIAGSEALWADWTDRLLRLHQLWLRKGFMAMFQSMLRDLDVATALRKGASFERRLTDVLHLGELLQQASKAHSGMDALLAWYRQERLRALTEQSTEEAEMRLESDEALVQIVTIHASKGLEYPVVFIPYLWDCRPREPNGLLSFHRDGESYLDAGSDDFQAHLYLADKDRLAEDIRLAYVALTRAAAAIYLVWGNAGPASRAAMAYLLHPHQDSDRLDTVMADAFLGLTSLHDDLMALVTAAKGAIHMLPIPASEQAETITADQSQTVGAVRPFTGHIASDWRIASFTALTRDVHSVSSPARDREATAQDPGLYFPAGNHVGSYLHILLEKLDFKGDVKAQVREHSARVAGRFNLDHQVWGDVAAHWLALVIESPLDAAGLRLSHLDRRQRLNELPFDFATGPVDTAKVDALLVDMAGRPLPPLGAERFQGLVTGVIDMLYEHQGRYYIADYKSNFLGASYAHYSPGHLASAVHERRYDLQYLLYALAVHRYLRCRIPGYDYDVHFGGVYYLFLRGMRPDGPPGNGVFHARPARAWIDALDGLFGFVHEGLNA